LCVADGDDFATPTLTATVPQRSTGTGGGDWELSEVAKVLAELPEDRAPQVGFIGYGQTTSGDRILLAVDSLYDQVVVDTVAAALRDKGASVDVIVTDLGGDRPFDHHDEIAAVIRDEHWTKNPRRWEGLPWIEEFAGRAGYDLLLHGRGGPTPATDYRYEQFPWLKADHLRQGAGAFPRDLHRLINLNTWSRIWNDGRGSRVRLTDPEGTDLTFTLHEEYFDGSRRNFTETPTRAFGHLLGHAPTPILPNEDATGVIAGTTSHIGRPFPQIRVYLEGGRVEAIEGGGRYGDAWREILAETKDIQYPCFPRPGLFWLWEVAIGTNPWIRRSPDIHMLSSGGFEWERRRTGVIHCGFGTRWRGSEEEWAASQRVKFGHLHVHLLFPTYEMQTPGGHTVQVIERGHLKALDDPEVVDLARELGDPQTLLTERWAPSIPGISAPGQYADFARDPEPFVYGAN
jgi:hypothetical protein